jgi:probable HAF family extracellular repeat protein
MKLNKLSWCLGLLFAASTCLAQMYTVTDLGTVQSGDNAWSIATGINESGQVVGVSDSTEFGSQFHAFRTAPNTPINPATDDFGPDTFAVGINNSGQVVGFFYPNRPQDYAAPAHSFRTAPNRRLDPATDDLDTTLGLGLYGGSQVYGINDAGQAVGVYSGPPTVGEHSFRTAPNMPINPETDDIGGPPGEVEVSEAYAVNSFGQVVGMFGSSTAPGHGFRTAPNRPINPVTDDVGTLSNAPHNRSVAYGINDFGQAVVGSIPFYSISDGIVFVAAFDNNDNATFPSHAFRTAPNRPINPATDDLGTLGGNLSVGIGIDNFGQVVGFSNLLPGYVSYHAFLHSGRAMHDLNHLIPASSGWEVSAAIGINSKGQIAANGVRNGSGGALLLTPIYRGLVQRPIDADRSSVFSAKRGIVPVKFAVTKYGKYASCTLPATISVTRAVHGTLTPVPESTYSKAGDGSNFRIAGCRYHYNLPARSLGVGTYRVDISISGIMVGHAVFALKSGRREDDKDHED